MLAIALTAALAAAPTPFSMTSGEVTFEIEAPVDTIKGVSRGVTGSITLDPDAWTTSPQATVTIALDSFKTGIDLRDEDLRDQFFEVDKFRAATLTVTALERPSVTRLEKGVTAEAFAKATLSLHGVEREIVFPIKVVYDDEGARPSLGVSGAFVVPLESFAMKRPQRLLFKLGKDVRVVVRGRLRAPPPTTQLTPDPVVTTLPLPPPVVARPPPATEKPPAPTFAFAATTPEGKGERAFADAGIGGPGNAITCKSCHGVHDERLGQQDPKGKTVAPSSSMWGVAKRGSWWRGVGRSPQHAASICARMFMLRKDNLAKAVEDNVGAYLAAISKDPLPPHDYAGTLLAKAKDTPTTTAALPRGDARRGAVVIARTCARCHNKGAIRPELTPGLYSKSMIVARVRGLRDGDQLQMPSYALDRLTDTELADVVALLADDKQRIFTRK